MNDQSASARRADDTAGPINGFASHPDLVETRDNVAAPELFEHETHEFTDHLRLWPLWLRGQELGAEDGQNNEFMTVLSHELRNSRCAIRFALGILRVETSARAAALRARMQIELQVAQMTRLVDDLLDVSRIRHGQLTLQRQRVDLCVVVTHAAQTVAFTMQERNHRLRARLSSAPLWMQGDPARLEQVFVNLLCNAAKYTDPGGRIWLSAEREQGEAVVRIRDTGIGIDRSALPHVFDLFVHANPSSCRPDAGSGIGLALVRSLVEVHGGHVGAASAGRGNGSEFTVRLPMAAE
jgi:signal transduction histidine kinase